MISSSIRAHFARVDIFTAGGLRNGCCSVRRSYNPAHLERSVGRCLAWSEVLSDSGMVETRQR